MKKELSARTLFEEGCVCLCVLNAHDNEQCPAAATTIGVYSAVGGDALRVWSLAVRRRDAIDLRRLRVRDALLRVAS